MQIKINEAVLGMDAQDAFRWLTEQFWNYSHGKTIWVDVKSVLATAEAIKAKWGDAPSPEASEHVLNAVRAFTTVSEPVPETVANEC